jgi:uncharacterized protein (TIGR03435 family)
MSRPIANGITAVVAPFVIGLLGVHEFRGQPQQETAPAFEVASVRPHKTNDNRRSTPQFLPGGRFTSTGVPLRFLIAIAYNVGFQSVRLSGGLAWINSMDEAYDVEATAAPGTIPAGVSSNARMEKQRLMLRTLLGDRFKLTVRRETKELPVYAVTVAKNGPKLERASIEEKDCTESGTPGVFCHSLIGGRGRGLHGAAVSLTDVLGYVENWTDHPLVDKTGIQGLYNVQTSGWLPMQPGPPPPAGAKAEDGSDLADVPTLFTLFERLGLKLESQRAPVDVFVIEQVEKPSVN